MLSVDIKITRGSAPAAGFEAEAPAAPAAPQNPVAQARANGSGRRRIRADHAGDRSVLAAMGRSSGGCGLRIQRLIESTTRSRFFACDENLVRSEVRRWRRSRRTGIAGRSAWRRSGRMGGRSRQADSQRQSGGRTGICRRGPGAWSRRPRWLCRWSTRDAIVGVLALYRHERDAFAADEMVTLLGDLPGAGASHDWRSPNLPMTCWRWPPPSSDDSASSARV